MYTISKNNIITINAGDYFDWDFTINLNSNYDVSPYVMKEGDVLMFVVVEPNQPFLCGVVKKQFTLKDFNTTNKTVHIHLDSSDTENLLPGTYYYEIKLSQSNSQDKEILTTVSSRKKFYIL